MARRPTTDVERIERLEAENERLRAAIDAAQEALRHHKPAGPSIDFDRILARLRNALDQTPAMSGNRRRRVPRKRESKK
jgi:uncharacterized membrane protein YccC